MGDGSKIDAGEIAIKTNNTHQKLSDFLEGLQLINGSASSPKTIVIDNTGLYILLVSVPANNNESIGVYVIHSSGANYQYLQTINGNGYVDVTLSNKTLTLDRDSRFRYALLKLL